MKRFKFFLLMAAIVTMAIVMCPSINAGGFAVTEFELETNRVYEDGNVFCNVKFNTGYEKNSNYDIYLRVYDEENPLQSYLYKILDAASTQQYIKLQEFKDFIKPGHKYIVPMVLIAPKGQDPYEVYMGDATSKAFYVVDKSEKSDVNDDENLLDFSNRAFSILLNEITEGTTRLDVSLDNAGGMVNLYKGDKLYADISPISDGSKVMECEIVNPNTSDSYIDLSPYINSELFKNNSEFKCEYIFVKKPGQTSHRVIKVGKGNNTFKVKKYQETVLKDASISSGTALIGGELYLTDNNKVSPYGRLYLNLNFNIDKSNIRSINCGIESANNENIGQSIEIKFDGDKAYIDMTDTQIRSKLPEGTYKIVNISYFYGEKVNEQTSQCVYFDLNKYNKVDNLIKEKYNISLNEKDLQFVMTSSEDKESAENTIYKKVIDGNSNTSPENVLKSISLSKNTAKLNEKIYINVEFLYERFDIINMTLNFYDAKTSQTMIVNARDCMSKSGKPYIVVPLTTASGEYELTNILITSKMGVDYYIRKGKSIGNIAGADFDVKLNIDSVQSNTEDENIFELENGKITEDIINKIKNLPENVSITVNAYENTIIRKELFEAIRGKNKVLVINTVDGQWIFNGADIIEGNVKTIDVGMNMLKTTDANVSKDISSMVNEALVLSYADNGKLPGKALIKIRATEAMRKYLDTDKVYVYYFNEENQKLEKIAYELEIVDGFFQFYINHNSDYVMTSNKVDDIFVDEVSSKEIYENNQEKIDSSTAITSSNTINVYQIVIIALAAIILVLVIVLIVKSIRKNKNNN